VRRIHATIASGCLNKAELELDQLYPQRAFGAARTATAGKQDRRSPQPGARPDTNVFRKGHGHRSGAARTADGRARSPGRNRSQKPAAPVPATLAPLSYDIAVVPVMSRLVWEGSMFGSFPQQRGGNIVAIFIRL